MGSVFSLSNVDCCSRGEFCTSQLSLGVCEALPNEVIEGDLIVDLAAADGANWHCICSNVAGQPIAVLQPEKDVTSDQKNDVTRNTSSFLFLLGRVKPEIHALFFAVTAKGEKTFNKQIFSSTISLTPSPGPSVKALTSEFNDPDVRSTAERRKIRSLKGTSTGVANAFMFFALFRGSGSEFMHEGMHFFQGVPAEGRWCLEVIGQSYHVFDGNSDMGPFLPKLIRGLHPPTSFTEQVACNQKLCALPQATATAGAGVEWDYPASRTDVWDDEEAFRMKEGGPDEIV